MMWFFAVLIVLSLGAVVVVASGEGDPLSEEHGDTHDVLVPADRPITGADLRDLRFNTAVRGYRADEVDALLDRLATQLDAASPKEGPDSGSMGE